MSDYINGAAGAALFVIAFILAGFFYALLERVVLKLWSRLNFDVANATWWRT